jgi:DNA-binding SARP family transcriptional activator
VGVRNVLAGRWSAPLPDPVARGGLSLDGVWLARDAASAPLLIEPLLGEIHVQRLVADLTRLGHPPDWASLAPYDLDGPALDALATPVGSGTEGVGPAADGRLVVVESNDRRQAQRFVSRLATARRPESPPPALILRYRRPAGMRRWPGSADRMAHGAILGNAALDRLTSGRLALYDSVLDAGRRLRPGELAEIIARSRTADDLTVGVATRLLEHLPPPTTTVLGFAALLGYVHPRFHSLEPVVESCGHLPWWTELAGGWRRLEPVWRDAVFAVCRSDRRPQVELLGRLVRELLEEDEPDAAIELCLDAGYLGTASDLLAGLGPDLVVLGRPRAVRRWLRRLPWSLRRRHGRLAADARAAPVDRDPPWVPARRWPAPADGSSSRAGPRQPGVSLLRRGAGAEPSGVGARPSGADGPGRPEPLPTPTPCTLEARLLGPVDIAVAGRRVAQWHGRKGTQLLAYLLLHRDGQAVARDALAANFWPDAPPDAARNRLHVALHTLRVDLQKASPVPIVLFEHGYMINPELAVRLDTEAFERAVARGKRAERDGSVDAALAAYRDAAREYRGDLLSDHPYDDWTLLPREHYRVRMLDALGQIVQMSFDAGRYAEAVAAGQRLLALDFCREDLHRLLMRAYSRLGRPHLALHQFEICARQLRRDLDIAPAPETVGLYERIRARSLV